MKKKEKIKTVETLLLENGFKKHDLNNGLGKIFKKTLSQARLSGIQTGYLQISRQSLAAIETVHECLLADDNENALMTLETLKLFLSSAAKE